MYDGITLLKIDFFLRLYSLLIFSMLLNYYLLNLIELELELIINML